MAKRFIKVAVFVAFLVGLLVSLNRVFMPIWLEEGVHDRLRGFYEVPKNTIDTVVIGPCIAAYDFVPWEWYDKFGIAGYTLGNPLEPLVASDYWLKEAHRRHPETLKTVIFEPQLLGRESGRSSFHRMAFDTMELSLVKMGYIWRIAKKDPEEAFSYLFPLYKYHTRWNELQTADFRKNRRAPEAFRMGNFREERRFFDNSDLPNLPLGPRLPNSNAKAATFPAEDLRYLERIVKYCRQNGLNLVFVKTPVAWMGSEVRKGVEALAKHYNVPFVDFNAPDRYRQLQDAGFVMALNHKDISHMNWTGAQKLSLKVGEFLVENGLAQDVRGNPKYRWFEEQRPKNERAIGWLAKLEEISDVAVLLEFAKTLDGVTTFIAVRDEGSAAMNDAYRQKLWSLGYEKLSKLRYRQSYGAVVEGGKIRESTGTVHTRTEVSGRTADGSFYHLVSAGRDAGNRSSIVLGNEDRSVNSRGLNIVLYDNFLHRVLYRTSFDTYSSMKRAERPTVEGLKARMAEDSNPANLTPEWKKLYEYLKKIDTEYKPKQEAFLK